MVNRAIEEIEGFPDELANRLTHVLLSHHGQREYGAPVLPMTAEACALHYADNLDAHVQYFSQVVAQGAEAGSQWSDYQRLFERYIYVGARADAPGARPTSPGHGQGDAAAPGAPQEQGGEGEPGRLFDR